MELPEDLAGIERELAAANRRQPAPELRGRVLERVRRELARPSSRRILRGGAWTLAAAAAAALLWMNFSLAGAGTADWCSTARPRRSSLAEDAAALQEILPELSDRDALGRVLTLRSGERLLLLPAVGAKRGPKTAPLQEEN
ncbi:MAG: hypothetical protein ACYTGB_12690 [Planctomycetota bacterium]|jgi:hypothetical protein